MIGDAPAMLVGGVAGGIAGAAAGSEVPVFGNVTGGAIGPLWEPSPRPLPCVRR